MSLLSTLKIFHTFFECIYYGLYDLKTRTATSTSVHENLYIKHAQNHGKPYLESSVARDERKKVSCDVLMKTCNILSKIMVTLDIHGIKVLTIFTVEYHTTFFEFILKDWACVKCCACFFFGLCTFSASNSPYHKPVSAVTSKRGRSSLSGKNPSSRLGRIILFWKTENLNCRCACR